MNTFSLTNYLKKIEESAHAGGWKLDYLSSIDGIKRPWLKRVAQTKSPESAPRFYLSTGIHGDEIAGPLAVISMLNQEKFFASVNATIFPLLNPVGLTRGTRGNASGIDLNRDYRALASPEIAGHVEVLKSLGPFDACLFLHEDFEGNGAYLYELNEKLSPLLGRKIMEAMSHHVPLDLRSEIEGVPADQGILSRHDLIKLYGRLEDRVDWPEAIYLSMNHTQVSYTTETPMLLPLEQRVAAQIAATETLITELT